MDFEYSGFQNPITIFFNESHYYCNKVSQSPFKCVTTCMAHPQYTVPLSSYYGLYNNIIDR